MSKNLLLHKVSNMSAHILFIEFIKRVGESEKMRGLLTFYRFVAMSLIYVIILSTNVRFYLSYDIKQF